jgi:hypothetical protein
MQGFYLFKNIIVVCTFINYYTVTIVKNENKLSTVISSTL